MLLLLQYEIRVITNAHGLVGNDSFEASKKALLTADPPTVCRHASGQSSKSRSLRKMAVELAVGCLKRNKKLNKPGILQQIATATATTASQQLQYSSFEDHKVGSTHKCEASLGFQAVA